MRVNSELSIVGTKVVLVPYRSLHVPSYHTWMSSPELQELTASEPLTVEEEYAMQKSWLEDECKCTFIVLDKERYESTGSEIESMIGDTNLFLVDPDDKSKAEIEIMIAEPWARGNKRGWEATLLMLKYGISLGIRSYQAKIGLSNTTSLAMFHKLQFTEVSRSHVFIEATLERAVDQAWIDWLETQTSNSLIKPHPL